MNEEKNKHLFNAGLALAIALVVSSVVVGWSYTHKKSGDEAVTVTGSARKRIKSDLVVWSAGVSYQAPQLSEAYKQLSDNIPLIKKYLIGKGIRDFQITTSSISSTTLKGRDPNGNETSETTGYMLRQQVEVHSNDVDLIAQIAREATELINQGILLESNPPQYSYTKIGDLKIEMLGEAAKDAKERAEKIAASTGNKIGTLRSAKMGVMQITAADSTDVSDSGISDSSSIDKDMTAVVNIQFCRRIEKKREQNMKMKIYLWCAFAALATFVAGVGFFGAGQYVKSVFSTKQQKTEYAAPAPTVVEQAQSPVVEQVKIAEETKVDTEPVFDAEGFYDVIDKSPKGFEDFKEIGVITRNYENASEENNYEGTPIPPEGYVWTDKEFKFTKISISSQRMVFETEIIKGVRYKFSGKFLDKVSSEKFDGQNAVLQGHLIKLKKGKKIAETNFSFYWYSGGC